MRAPYLERDEEHDLALQWRDDKDQAALVEWQTRLLAESNEAASDQDC